MPPRDPPADLAANAQPTAAERARAARLVRAIRSTHLTPAEAEEIAAHVIAAAREAGQREAAFAAERADMDWAFR